MTQRDGSDSHPAAGVFWHMTLRYDELEAVELALSGHRLSAEHADQAALVLERLVKMREQIERQAR